MSITRFRYFSKVAQLGSIRQAADVLRVAPSAISRQIAKLERELGAELLEANGRGIRLTPAGEILAVQASQMIDALEQARSQVDDLLGLRRGHVRLWTAEGSVDDLVLPALAAFKLRYPAVSYELTTASSDRIVSALLNDDADLGIVFNPPEHPDLGPLGSVTDALHAIGHPRHPGLRARRMTLAEIVSYPLALPDETFGLRHMIDGAAKTAGLKLAPALVTNSIRALRAFASVGIGVTILPRLAVAGDLKAHAVRAIPLTDRALRVARTTILVRRERRLPVAVTALAEQLGKIAETFGR